MALRVRSLLCGFPCSSAAPTFGLPVQTCTSAGGLLSVPNSVSALLFARASIALAVGLASVAPGLTTRSSEQRLALGSFLPSTSFFASLCR